MCHAMYDLLKNKEIYPEFRDVINNHFKLKKDYIINKGSYLNKRI